MSTERFVELLEECGLDVRTNYSGRGMYGDCCIGFDVNSEQAAFVAVAETMLLAVDAAEREELVDVFRGCKTDSMGRGMIIYFPKMKTPR